MWRGSVTCLLHTKQANGCSLVSWKSRTCMIGFVYSSLGCLICEYRRDCTAPNKVSCRQSKNYDLQSVCSTCSTCKNVRYMYRTFSAVSVAHVAKERFSREVLQNENSNEVSRQSLRKCVRIFARTLRSAHFRSLRGPSARTPWPDLTKFPTTVHFVFPASFASKVAKVRARFRTSWCRAKVCTHFRFAEPL